MSRNINKSGGNKKPQPHGRSYIDTKPSLSSQINNATLEETANNLEKGDEKYGDGTIGKNTTANITLASTLVTAFETGQSNKSYQLPETPCLGRNSQNSEMDFSMTWLGVGTVLAVGGLLVTFGLYSYRKCFRGDVSYNPQESIRLDSNKK